MKNKLYLIFLIGMFVSGCSKDTCRDEDKGIYIYPEAPVDMSFWDALKLYEMPKNVLHCISTDALFQTDILYPEIRMIWTRSTLQEGFDFIRENFNGFDELFNRRDAYQVIVEQYKKLDINRDWDSFSDLENGYFIVNIIHHELILAQFDLLRSLTKEQKEELLKLALDNQKMKFVLKESYAVTGMQPSLSILARIMYNDQYHPFMEEYKLNEPLRLEIESMKIVDSDLVQIITDLSEEYLKTFKN